MKPLFTTLICLILCVVADAQKDSGYFASFDGRKIYFEVAGKGSPVVLIHGFIVNGASWKRVPLYNDLLKAGYQVITMDLRGNGQSDKPHEAAAYANDAEAKDVIGLLDHLHVKSYQVVGYSRGSIITARLLLLDKRIRSAVMGGMGDGFTDPQWPRRILFYRALSGEPVKELESMVNYVKSNPSLDQQALALLQKEQPSVTPDLLATIRIPVLLIDGDNDPDNGSPQNLAKMFPNAQLKIIPGDHGSAMRGPQFAEAILQFLK